MADIKWCESPNALDCLADGEWDLMVTYIKHSAVTDFTIYGTEGTCVDTGQAFKFSQTGVLSKMYGGADTGDILKISANSTDAEPYILLDGDDFALIDVASYVEFQDQGEQMFKFEHTSPTSYMYGSDDTGDDLIILANEQDDCSSISLFGNLGIKCEIKATSIFEVATCTDETLFEIDSAAGNHHADFHCMDVVNFVLENRTDDPVSPCVGQMWFRTDLV